MLEVFLFEDPKRTIGCLNESSMSIEDVFSEVNKIRQLIINGADFMEIETACDIAGLFHINDVDTMSKLARIEVRILQVKYHLQALKYAEENSIESQPLIWAI